MALQNNRCMAEKESNHLDKQIVSSVSVVINASSFEKSGIREWSQIIDEILKNLHVNEHCVERCVDTTNNSYTLRGCFCGVDGVHQKLTQILCNKDSYLNVLQPSKDVKSQKQFVPLDQDLYEYFETNCHEEFEKLKSLCSLFEGREGDIGFAIEFEPESDTSSDDVRRLLSLMLSQYQALEFHEKESISFDDLVSHMKSVSTVKNGEVDLIVYRNDGVVKIIGCCSAVSTTKQICDEIFNKPILNSEHVETIVPECASISDKMASKELGKQHRNEDLDAINDDEKQEVVETNEVARGDPTSILHRDRTLKINVDKKQSENFETIEYKAKSTILQDIRNTDYDPQLKSNDLQDLDKFRPESTRETEKVSIEKITKSSSGVTDEKNETNNEDESEQRSTEEQVDEYALKFVKLDPTQNIDRICKINEALDAETKHDEAIKDCKEMDTKTELTGLSLSKVENNRRESLTTEAAISSMEGNQMENTVNINTQKEKFSSTQDNLDIVNSKTSDSGSKTDLTKIKGEEKEENYANQNQKTSCTDHKTEVQIVPDLRENAECLVGRNTNTNSLCFETESFAVNKNETIKDCDETNKKIKPVVSCATETSSLKIEIDKKDSIKMEKTISKGIQMENTAINVNHQEENNSSFSGNLSLENKLSSTNGKFSQISLESERLPLNNHITAANLPKTHPSDNEDNENSMINDPDNRPNETAARNDKQRSFVINSTSNSLISPTGGSLEARKKGNISNIAANEKINHGHICENVQPSNMDSSRPTIIPFIQHETTGNEFNSTADEIDRDTKENQEADSCDCNLNKRQKQCVEIESNAGKAEGSDERDDYATTFERSIGIVGTADDSDERRNRSKLDEDSFCNELSTSSGQKVLNRDEEVMKTMRTGNRKDKLAIYNRQGKL